MNVVDEDMVAQWVKSLTDFTGEGVEIQNLGIIGGGSINDARRVDTSHGTFFAKINDAEAFPAMFEAEVHGLTFLAEHSNFEIPKPVGHGETSGSQWILMQFVDRASPAADYWENFGKGLAELHKKTNVKFGLDRENYLGNLQQKNGYMDTWAGFFAEHRIAPQLKMARDQNYASTEMVRLLEKLMGRVDRYFPVEPPAAIHGDLWTGNFCTNHKGEATIFDPSAHYGHREMDIAMSKLFGGFDERFYEAYNAHYPLEKDWETRLPIANLYPLLAHLNIFGETYASQIMNILRKNL